MGKITHNNEWEQIAAETKNLTKLDLGTETVDWMRSPDGLVYLTQAWRTSLQLLRKTNIFSGTADTYRLMKKDGYVVGFDVYMKDESDEYELPSDHWDEEAQEWVNEGYYPVKDTKEIYIFVLHICFYRKNEAVDCFTSLTDEERELLAKGVLDKVNRIKVIETDPALSDHFTEQERGQYYDLGWCKKWDQNNAGYCHDNSVTGVLNIVDDAKFLKSVSGAEFGDIAKIISQYRPTAQHSSAAKVDKARLFRGTAPTTWEEILTEYLLQEGFIVSLEPDIYFPDNGVIGRRVPDLLVIHKGRAIAIEIDDRSHLVYIHDSPDGKHRKGEVNLERWQTDRMLDRRFLSNGVPVLRVWYVEVDKYPERILTEIMNIYDSLGGERMRLR